MFGFQGNTGNSSGGLSYQGTWNALLNIPALASGIGVNGEYYVVSVAGTTNLDGVNDWQVGDWAIFNGTTWQKIDNTDSNELIITNRQIASYSLALTDINKLVEMNVASANNLTIPLDSSIPFAIGTQIVISQYGAGQTTILPTGGVTLRSAGGKTKLTSQYSGSTLIKIATDEWYLFGDITT